MATYNDWKEVLAPVVDNGVPTDSARLWARIHEAQKRLFDYANFIARREDYSDGFSGTITATGDADTTVVVDNLTATKMAIMAAWREENNQVEMAMGLMEHAYKLVENDIIQKAEAGRRNYTVAATTNPSNATAVATGEVVRKLHNELPDGVKYPSARLTSLLAQANSEAEAHQKFVQRREDYSGTAPAISYEIQKKLVESYLATSRNEVEIATATKKEAFEIIERDIIAAVEESRRDYSTDTFVKKLHNELPDGVKFPSDRLLSLASQAGTEAAAHANFVKRREDYKDATYTASDEVRKKLVESYLATSRNEVEIATATKKEAFEIIERDIIALAETARRDTLGEAGVLHNELPDGVKIPTARINSLLTQAGTEAAAHQAFVQRREDYKGNTPPVSLEIKKKLVESYLATSRNEVEIATATKKEALELIERDVVAVVETSRRNQEGDVGHLHNELPDGVKTTTARLTQYLTRATTEAQSHQNFVQRREDYEGAVPSTTFEVKKKLVESYLATSRGEAEYATACKKEAFELIERDVFAAIESNRRDASASEEGRLHNELPDGVKIPTSRLTVWLGQATSEIQAHQAFVQRREDYSGVTPTITFELRKKLVESYLATSRGEAEYAAACKKEAFELIERDVITAAESSRRNVPGDTGRLHNELLDGVKVPTSRLTAYLAQAVTEAQSHQAFIQRREDYFGTSPTITFEVQKKLVESYLATSKGETEYATACKKEAFELIERDVVALVESSRRNHTHPRINRLHNELSDGVKVPSTRMAVYRNQALADAAAHRRYLQREEDYTSEPAPHSLAFSNYNFSSYPQWVQITNIGNSPVNMAGWKILGHAYNENITPPCVLSPSLSPSTFVFPAGVTLAPGANVRVYSGAGSATFNNPGGNPPTFQWNGMEWDNSGDVAFLHSPEDTVGIDFPESTLTLGACAIPAPDISTAISAEVEKKLVESYLATSRGEAEYAQTCKKEALELIERDVRASIEDSRKLASGDVGRLHNEVPGGLKIKTSRMQEYLQQANEILTMQWKLATRNEDLNLPVPEEFKWESVKLCVQSLVYQSKSELEAAAATKQQALDSIDTEVQEQFVPQQRDELKALFDISDVDTLGNYVARLGLDLAETGLSMPTSKIVRLINTAEETLFTKGRWAGTTQNVKVTVGGSGEIELPGEVETVLGATFEGYPVSIMSRELEYAESGPGYLGGNKTNPTIVVPPTASPLSYGQSLSQSTLSNGVASVPGSFAFLSPTTVPNAGQQVQVVVFNPTDTNTYNSIEIEVPVTVSKVTPTITTNPTTASVPYGISLADVVLVGGVASVPGVFSFANPSLVPNLGASAQSVVFTPSDITNYNTVTGITIQVTVVKATPVILVPPTATAITFGQVLGQSSLVGGLANVPGSFLFQSPSTAPGVGTASHTVRFVPQNTVAYNEVTVQISVTVGKATPSIVSVPTPSTIGNGQALSNSTLTGGSAVSNGLAVAGTFAFQSPPTVPPLGLSAQQVVFTPTNTTNYNTATATVYVTVQKSTPVITSIGTASPITYGQTLSASEITGTVASVAGAVSFKFPNLAPASGTALQAVVFAPADTNQFNTVETTISVLVNKANSVIITPPTASAIIEGQSLAVSNLTGGAANVPGVFTFTNPSTIPTQTTTHNVTFTPNDSNYNTATTTVSVTVNVLEIDLTFPTASSITFGQSLSSSTFSGGVSSVPGTFVWKNPSFVPNAGTASYLVQFIPSSNLYEVEEFPVALVVAKATPTIFSSPTASGIFFGETLSGSSTLTGGSASVPGAWTFTAPADFVPLPGAQSVQVLFTPTDAVNYNAVPQNITVVVSYFFLTISVTFTSSATSANQGNLTVPRVNSWAPGAEPAGALGVFFLTSQGTATWNIPIKLNDPTRDFAEISIFHTISPISDAHTMSWTSDPAPSGTEITLAAAGNQRWTKLFFRANASVTVNVANA